VAFDRKTLFKRSVYNLIEFGRLPTFGANKNQVIGLRGIRVVVSNKARRAFWALEVVESFRKCSGFPANGIEARAAR
jgi:hypothetical protein